MKFATPLKFGLLGGICAVIVKLVWYLINPLSLSPWMGFLVYAPLLFSMIYGGITYRKENNELLNFGQAFTAVWIIALVSSIMLNAFNSIVLMKIVDPTLREKIMEKAIEQVTEQYEKAGLSDEMIEQNLDKIKSIDGEISGLISNLVISLILSLIIALFVKRNPEQITPVSETNE